MIKKILLIGILMLCSNVSGFFSSCSNGFTGDCNFNTMNSYVLSGDIYHTNILQYQDGLEVDACIINEWNGIFYCFKYLDYRLMTQLYRIPKISGSIEYTTALHNVEFKQIMATDYLLIGITTDNLVYFIDTYNIQQLLYPYTRSINDSTVYCSPISDRIFCKQSDGCIREYDFNFISLDVLCSFGNATMGHEYITISTDKYIDELIVCDGFNKTCMIFQDSLSNNIGNLTLNESGVITSVLKYRNNYYVTQLYEYIFLGDDWIGHKLYFFDETYTLRKDLVDVNSYVCDEYNCYLLYDNLLSVTDNELDYTNSISLPSDVDNFYSFGLDIIVNGWSLSGIYGIRNDLTYYKTLSFDVLSCSYIDYGLHMYLGCLCSYEFHPYDNPYIYDYNYRFNIFEMVMEVSIPATTTTSTTGTTTSTTLYSETTTTYSAITTTSNKPPNTYTTSTFVMNPEGEGNFSIQKYEKATKLGETAQYEESIAIVDLVAYMFPILLFIFFGVTLFKFKRTHF